VGGFQARTIAIATAAVLAVATVGCGDSSDAQSSRAEAQAVAQYRSYLEENAETLVGWLQRLNEQVEAGHLLATQSRFNSARVPYGHLEPLTASLGTLALRMNAGRGDVNRSEFGGFHRIEEILWHGKTVDGVAPVARRLLHDAEELRRRAATVALRPAAIAAELNRTLAAVSASEIAGKEDPLSHLDLVDIAAKVEGVEAGFDALKPALLARDAALARKIRTKLEQAYVALSDFGFAAREAEQPRPSSPGTSFVLYVERSAEEFRRLDQHLDALAQPLSQIPSQLPGEAASP
jgi:iron uptake system component EfeO